MGRSPIVTTPIDADPIVLEFVRRQRETASTFAGWLAADSPGLNWEHRHIVAIREALDRVTSGESPRLIITVPPQHGKSSLATVRYPVWRIIRDPRLPVIVGSYNEEKAAEFATKARKIAARWVSFSKDVNRVDEWQTTVGGGIVSVGTTSGTGRPAKLFILDDLFKDPQDAESFARREAVWRWYTQVVMTRRPEAIILIACMAGDTEVTMADGSEKLLRDIAVGDAVATLDDGRITTSRVLNWINHGPDSVYEIRMTSGIIIKANERHPFLVDRGGAREWIQLKNLRVGDTLLRVRSRKERGAESIAHSADAFDRLSARDTATPITTRLDGRLASGRHPSIQCREERGSSGTAMASLGRSTMRSPPRKEAGALYAGSFPARTTCQNTGPESCVSTTAMRQERSADCSVTTAISSSETEEPKRSCLGPLNTFEIAPDQIVEIVPAGSEDVFDIEVERTENFIANGVVSHNTRWHEDDLTGRLLADKEANPAWEHVHLKALATENDPLGREVGEALCPEMQSREALLEWQRIDPFAFMTMGQGEVAPREGSLFEIAKMPIMPGAEVPSGLPMVRAWDLAASSSEKSDETAGVLMSGPGPGGIYYVLDVVHGHWEPSERNRQILQTARADGIDVPIWSPQDPGPHGKEAAERIMELLDGFRAATHSVLTRQGARPDSKKMRAEPWRSRVNEGKVRVVDGPWTKFYIEQHRRFTGGHGKDDMVDASALAYAALRTERTPGDYGIG